MRLRRLLFATSIMGLLLTSSGKATTVIPPDFTQLIQESDYVVQAVVKSVTAVNKAQPSQRPIIYSQVKLEVKEVIAGNPPNPLILEVVGGKLGDQAMYITGAPKFTVGEESIFFVQGNGTQIYPLARMMHGLYPILKDPATGKEYVARSNGRPMESIKEVQLPMHSSHLTPSEQSKLAAGALSPSDFITQIRSTEKEIKARELKSSEK